ncbi:MAG: MBOAT family protein [Planctomycetes bacterium]|nr:MBOAT family protein [Planctomycetota bacterium]
MQFHSFTFFAFLAVVLGLHYALPRAARRHLLLVASYVFYGAWDWRFLLLIALSTAIDFVAALRIEAAREPATRRRWLVLSLLLNLGVLGFFKYTNFFLASFCALTGADPTQWLLPIVLPVGISFFTFQSMSYTIDVYRRQIAARRSLVDFALFVAFFPQLVAGPIVKAIEFFPGYDRWRAPGDADLQRAAMLVLVGLVQKSVLADNLAPVVDGYFGDQWQPGWLAAATATTAFGLQIYFDFAGYSNIAIGVALLFGYRFPVNFRTPYLAGSVAEFWNRWHISLSTWLRDYLYIPLGGNRGGVSRTQRNLMLTMLLGGLWHGASWNFVLWGGLHGLYLAAHRAHRFWLHPRLGPRVVASLPYRAAAWLLTLAAVGFAWVFFRCVRLDDGLRTAGELLLPARLGESVLSTPWLLVIAGTLAIAWLADRWQLFARIDGAHWGWRGAVFAALWLVLTVFAATDSQVAFLYFQF